VRCTSWRGPTSSRRQARRRTSPASPRRWKWSARIRSCAISCGRTSAGCAGGCRSSATRLAAPNRRSCRFSPATKSARSRSGSTCSTKDCT
jgi:hypothetical protein